MWTAAELYNDLNLNGKYDDPITATELTSDFSGGGMIGKNYSGMDSALEALIDTSPKKAGIETLSAELRVKHGQFAISGSASVGQNSNVDGGTSKATVDGVFVNDGWAGNKGSISVFSDNGTSNAYDVDSLGIDLPLLSGIGSDPYVDSGGTSWSTQENYLDSRSLTIPVTSITTSTASFSYGPDAYGNSITFVNGNPCVVTVTGIFKVADGFHLGSKDSLRFAGSGTFYSPGTINIDGNFLPKAGPTFPTTTRIGFIAKNTINIAGGNGSSQLSLCGAFYAQNKITSAKQNKIAGTFVGSYFDMGTNVPNIYQVPSLRTNLPPGMPGADPIIFLKMQGWRER